jgi:TetR/AcrR family transcriptional regulator, regulator of autoinduction and epiphytic fitness
MGKAELVLQGAMQEFLVRGYSAASMDRVAVAAGVSKATVYSHFGDKETLFKELVAQMAQKRMQAIFSRMDYSLEPRIALRRLFSEAMQDCCTNVAFQNFQRMLIGESGRFPDLAKTFVTHLSKPGIEALTDYFRKTDGFDFPDPEAIARVVIGTIVHFAMTQYVLHGQEIVPFEADRLLDGLELLLFGAARP